MRTGDFEVQHYGANPHAVHLAVAMSWINYGLGTFVLVNSLASSYHAAAGVIVSVCVGFALSGRPVATIIRKTTGWAQGTCYPLGILLGNALGLVAGASFASYLG